MNTVNHVYSQLSYPLFPGFLCGSVPMPAVFSSRQHHSPLETFKTELIHSPGKAGLFLANKQIYI